MVSTWNPRAASWRLPSFVLGPLFRSSATSSASPDWEAKNNADRPRTSLLDALAPDSSRMRTASGRPDLAASRRGVVRVRGVV